MLNELSKEIYENAKVHGWWDNERSFSEIIALCHSELSEALEEERNSPMLVGIDKYLYYSGNGKISGIPTDICKNPEGIATELADCIIRILDYCGAKEINIDEIIHIKHEYNKTRPYKHGGKKI